MGTPFAQAFVFTARSNLHGTLQDFGLRVAGVRRGGTVQSVVDLCSRYPAVRHVRFDRRRQEVRVWFRWSTRPTRRRVQEIKELLSYALPSWVRIRMFALTRGDYGRS